jgi:hypothetical protein
MPTDSDRTANNRPHRRPRSGILSLLNRDPSNLDFGNSVYLDLSAETVARMEAQVRADHNGELPSGWAAHRAQQEIMRQPAPNAIRVGMMSAERQAARNGNMRANPMYLAGAYYLHPTNPDNAIARDTANIWRESEGGDCWPLPHYYRPAESIVYFGFLCRCDNPISHEGGAKGQRQIGWIKDCHEKLDRAGKARMGYLEYVEMMRDDFRRDWPGTYERLRPYDDYIQSLRTGRRQRMRPGRRGHMFG